MLTATAFAQSGKSKQGPFFLRDGGSIGTQTKTQRMTETSTAAIEGLRRFSMHNMLSRDVDTFNSGIGL